MTGKHHIIVGLATGATYASGVPSHSAALIAGAALVSGVAASLPDLDTPESIASTALRPLSVVVRALCLGTHRTLTHWPLLWGAVWIALCVFVVSAGWAHRLVVAASIGYMSHLLCDGLTTDGIPHILPWGHWHPLLLRFRYGGRVESMAVALIVVVCASVTAVQVAGVSVCGSGVCVQAVPVAWIPLGCEKGPAVVCGWPAGGVGGEGVRGGH